MSELMILCAVCFRGTDPVMTGSLNAGILVLMATTAGVLGCFGYFFVRLAQRAREAGDIADAPASLPHPFAVSHQPDRAR
jgi:hypothetical protein